MKSLRALRDNLVVAEKFPLAIEISLKSGLQKTGIMAAWGIACIKAGCFETGSFHFRVFFLTTFLIEKLKKNFKPFFSS